mgnify:CR=1 FL=1
MSNITLFEEKQVRRAWNQTDEKWYFFIDDVIGVLTGSANIKDYIKNSGSGILNSTPTGGQIRSHPERSHRDSPRSKERGSVNHLLRTHLPRDYLLIYSFP